MALQVLQRLPAICYRLHVELLAEGDVDHLSDRFVVVSS